MARIVVISVTDKPSHNREHEARHHDHDSNKQQIPGWAAERTPKDEPQVSNLNLKLGRWIDRASANSGPKIAPGTGKSSAPR
jgi:hypothetical protein